MFTVKIKSSSLVQPSEPTPNVNLFLSDCDQMKPCAHVRKIFIYPSNQVSSSAVSNPVETLETSLGRLLVSYYPLAGRLNCVEGGRLELHCNEVGVVLVEAEADFVIDDLGDFCPSMELEKLVPPVNYAKDISEIPLILFQFTKFKCGGICIGAAMHHTVVDGKGALQFINSWASLSRRGNESLVEPFHDRTIFYRGDPLAKPRFNHPELKDFPVLLGDEDPTEKHMKETSVTMMKVSKNQVMTLKKKANEGRSENDTSREFSQFEVMAGHLWRCVSKARKLRNEQLTSLRIIVDCRSRIHPPLPDGYYGNVVMVASPVAEVGELLLGLGETCKKIREALEKLNDDYVKSAIDFLAQKDLVPLRSAFHTSDVTKALFLGSPNLGITSWSGLGVHDADFGWGEPTFMGPTDMKWEGRSYIIPGRQEQGSFIIPIRLQVPYIADFQTCFYETI